VREDLGSDEGVAQNSPPRSFPGWLLAMSLVETQGFLLAWVIHFVQDVVIITSMILMSRKKATD